jgi:hypothetical protein
MPFSPLVDIVVSGLAEDPNLSSQQILHIRILLQSYVNDQISLQTCLAGVGTFPGATDAVHKLDTILHTPDSPIPRVPETGHASLKTHPWSPYEDQRLIAGIHRFGLHDWSLIASFVGNDRTKSQCSQRWFRSLDPSISRDQWSSEQDSRLLELVAMHGQKNWTRVSTEIGNRSDIQCRYRFSQLEKQDGFDDKMGIALESAKSTPLCAARYSKPRAKPRRPPQMPFQPQFATFHNFFPMFPVNVYPPPTPMMQIPAFGFQTTMVPPVVQMLPHPVQFEPPKVVQDAPKIIKQPEAESIGVPPQNPFFEWKGALSSSDSTQLLFGISPMNSFKFDG